MATTFNFEELDAATRDYLIAVRDAEGLGSPGVFVATSDSLPGCGCIAGPLIVALTLGLTLTTALDVIYNDPVKVALIQTAGLLLGGWLFFAKFRASKGTQKVAGNWVYVDPLHLYEAYREQVTVTPVEEVVEAHFTHNYNNGAYQNSVVNIALPGRSVAKVTFAHQRRAEDMVTYLNYLAWARGPDGGQRATLPPATLGGLAKYVAKNDHEPLDAESNINLSEVELDVTEVPEGPAREGRASPAVVPYLVMLVLAAVAFCVMAFVINPPLRDDAIFDAVMKEPSVEPRFLRAYLVDSRNRLHRDEVTRRLARFYDAPVEHVRRNGADKELREGLAKALEAVRTAEQPVVSLRVTEKGTPAGKEGGKAAREANVRTEFVTALNNEFARQPWGQPVQPPPGMTFKETPPPVGQQLLAFIEAPEDVAHAHFEITYTLIPGDFGQYGVSAAVEVRAAVEDADPVARGTLAPGWKVDANSLDTIPVRLKDDLVRAMAGSGGGANLNPGVVMPGFNPQ